MGDLLYTGAKDMHHLIPNSKQCLRCGRDMNLADRGSGPEGLAWRCPRKGCRKEVSIRVGTFLKVKVKNTKSFLIIMTISR